MSELESSDERSKTGFGLQEEENNSQSQTVPGTLLIPCRTAMRARFPLIETYFQDNEVFADYASMVRPINVPRNWMWNLQRWIVYFGTVSSILRDVVVMLGVALMLLGIQWVVAIMDQWPRRTSCVKPIWCYCYR
ncbi:hypothetical protein P8452_69824 [Trifolium repens]|nr:hypothetical protein P8452_69824 [Trifolium repens]